MPSQRRPTPLLLFGETPQETLRKARQIRSQGFRAVKFGWGSFGRTTVSDDADHLHAAREGLGGEGVLLIDAGTVWVEDVEAAALRLPALEEVKVLWLEEPFVSGALRAYRELARRSQVVRLAAGEGAHNPHLAEHLVDGPRRCGFRADRHGTDRWDRGRQTCRRLCARARSPIRQPHVLTFRTSAQ